MSFFCYVQTTHKTKPQIWMIRGNRVRQLKNHSRLTEVTRRLATLCIEQTKLITHYNIRVINCATNNIRQNVTFHPQSNQKLKILKIIKNDYSIDEVIDAVLNHAKQGVIKVYNQHRYDAEKQKALEAQDRKLNTSYSARQRQIPGRNGKV